MVTPDIAGPFENDVSVYDAVGGTSIFRALTYFVSVNRSTPFPHPQPRDTPAA